MPTNQDRPAMYAAATRHTSSTVTFRIRRGRACRSGRGGVDARDPAGVGARTSGSSRPRSAMRREIDRRRLGVTLFLVAAAASFVLSIVLWFSGSRQEGVFVGLWVPSILAAGAFWTVAVGREP